MGLKWFGGNHVSFFNKSVRKCVRECDASTQNVMLALLFDLWFGSFTEKGKKIGDITGS